MKGFFTESRYGLDLCLLGWHKGGIDMPQVKLRLMGIFRTL